MSIELAQVNRLMRQRPETPWPGAFEHGWLARLQTWTPGAENRTLLVTERPWIDAMRVDCKGGTLPHTVTTERRMTAPARTVVPDSHGFGDFPAFARIGGRMIAYTVPAQYKDITRWHIRAADFAQWLTKQGREPSALIAAWFKSQGVTAANAQTAPAPETAEQRQDRRLQMCIDAGLRMPSNHLRRLPNGVGDVARTEGVKRQTFTDDVKAALERKIERERPKPRLISSK